MKENKSGWQFPKALEIIKCKEGNKEFMKERPARRPAATARGFSRTNTVERDQHGAGQHKPN